ncbi:hypothetical protein MBLNU459_g0509t1 [Dothideomycetes sp. NU459]
MLEAREACWGATGRNGGHCQPLLYGHPSDPSIGQFELANFAAISGLIGALDIDCEFHAQPGVHALYSTESLNAAKSSLATLAQTCPEHAAQMQLFTSSKDLASLRVPSAKGAIVNKTAARMWPYKFVAHILETLLTAPHDGKHGRLNLQTHTPALSLSASSNDSSSDSSSSSSSSSKWTITTPRGTISTPRIILATNGYTSFLLPSFADLLVPCRGQMSALLPPAHLRGPARRLTASFGFMGPRQDDYLVQRPDIARRAAGATEHLMYGGGRARGPSLGVSDDSGVDAAVARYLRTELGVLLGSGRSAAAAEEEREEEEAAGRAAAPREELEATHEWTGIMGFSRDDVPFVGPVPGSPGVILAAGYTGHGMPNAWLCGAAAAIMAAREDAGDGEGAVKAAVEDPDVRLPRAYVLDEARLERVRAMKTVAEQDALGFYKAEFAD